ncbi:MAG: alpha/beta hydrolase [Thermodesulfobacteriota bacterium]
MEPFQITAPTELLECLTHPPQIVETAKGLMEYGEKGEGPVVLSVHGGPGGYDQGLGLGETFRANGFKIMAVSRPGYLGTPLETGRSCAEQADALAASIDALGLGKVAVIGASAGGPASYLLAARHADKVAALIEIDSVALKYEIHVSWLEEKLFLSKAGLWLVNFFLDHFPEAMVKSFLQAESTLAGQELNARVKEIVKDDYKLAWVRFLMATMSEKMDQRKAGLDNDLQQLAALGALPVQTIACPTLIIHGAADKDVVPAHAEYAHRAIKNSELYLIPGGSHLGFWTADTAYEAQEYAVRWLRGQIQ